MAGQGGGARPGAAGLGAAFSEGIAGMYMALNRDGIPFAGEYAQSHGCETPLEAVLAPAVAQAA